MSSYCQIVVKLELGHVAQAKNIPSLTGHTHDWMVFVRGPDGIAIEHFIEKVVFWLHESFANPKVVVKQPPYQVKQSGYAGFNILVDIHFKNKFEPKTVRFHYDMFLHMENMPPVNHTRVEMLTFTNPSEDFKKKLLKAGGIVKNQDNQPIKEKKKERKNQDRESEEKQKSSSLKEKNYRNDNNEKRVRPEKSQKSELKSKFKNGDKRRSSFSEFDGTERKKKLKMNDSEKVSSPLPPSMEKNSKEKLNKFKNNIDKSGSPSLFSREESINIKQIMKKEANKREDGKKEKRTEASDKKKSNKYGEKTKKEKKHSNDSNQSDHKVEEKSRRALQTKSPESDDTMTPLSDTDSEIKKKKKKKNQKRIKTVGGDITTETKYSTSLNISEKKKNHDKKTRVTPSGVKLHIKTLKNPNHQSRNIEQHLNQGISRVKKKKTNSEKNIPKTKKVIDGDSPDSLSSDSYRSDDEDSKCIIQRKQNDQGSSTAFSNVLQCNYDSSDSSIHSGDENEKLIFMKESSSGSDSETEYPESPRKLNLKSTSDETERVFEKSEPLVMVSTGPEQVHNRNLTEDIFQKLQKLQNMLSNITDYRQVKKVSSILQKSGQFTMDGTLMSFDLCSLDEKTIHKIQKQISAA